MKQLMKIKNDITNLLGKEVIIATKEQRGKVEEHNGRIDKVFGSFFNLETSGSNKQQLSFTFADILTNEIVVHSAEDGIIIENVPAHILEAATIQVEEEDLLEV